MIITPIFLALGGGVALFGCTSSVSSSNSTYCSDCGACSNCSYTMDGNSYQCGEYGCLGETFSCNTVGDCLSCFGLGCSTMAGNCMEQNCNGASNNRGVYRELRLGNDFVYRNAPEISYFQMIHTQDGGYYHDLRVYTRIEFFDDLATDVKISGNILYNGAVVDTFVYTQDNNSNGIVRDYNMGVRSTSLPADVVKEDLSVVITKIEATVLDD